MNLEEIKNNMNKDYNLSIYACHNDQAIRLHDENELEDIRPPFFRDIDRITYSLSYTRYINKTQVFTNEENDNITKRMTHVQMVSKVARTIGRALKLNEDLIEAAALGHDLGHVPFGHNGEAMLNEICLKEGLGYFNHNVESVRILKDINNQGNGNNLTVQVLDAILCHNGEIELEEYKPICKTPEKFLEEYENTYKIKEYNNTLIPMTLEGCVVRISDLIAYLGRDIEDAIRLNKIKKEDIPKDITGVLGSNNKEIINTLILDIIKNSYNKDYIKLSKEKFDALSKLKKFNYEYIYLKANDKNTIDKWKQMYNKLFYTYLSDLENNNKDSHIYKYFYNYMNEDYKNNTPIKRVVIDYLAGMTDNFLIREYNDISKTI